MRALLEIDTRSREKFRRAPAAGYFSTVR